jgi:hypothetical protein
MVQSILASHTFVSIRIEEVARCTLVTLNSTGRLDNGALVAIRLGAVGALTIDKPVAQITFSAMRPDTVERAL